MAYKLIEGGGVTTPKGFLAGACYVGVKSRKSEKPDVAIIYSEQPASCAALFTTNKFCAAPVILDREILKKGKARAVVINSGNANAATGPQGIEDAKRVETEAEKLLNLGEDEVFVCSTGVIGQILPIEPIETHIEELAKGLTADGNEKAATAIMTTDTVKKEVAVSFAIDGKTCHVGGMAKGSGMIHPNMATTLNFVTTDVCVAPQLVQKALSEIVKVTYNCLSVDGDTSTNDMVCVLANGQAGNAMITEEGEAYQQFYEALYLVLMNMTRMLAADGEGASKLLECTVSEARDLDTAIIVAKSVICSPLFKCAMFGEDANWGRVLCAIGYAKADFPIEKVDVDLASETGVLAVCRNGSGIPFSEEFAKEVLHADTIRILVNLHDGGAKATAWGCDLTYDYVKINGDYRS
mgnify:CR=1 FL=1